MAAAALRGVALFGLWLALGGGIGPADLAMGAIAAALAAWVSLRLMPATGGGVRPLAALRLAVGLVRVAVVAGFDIAFRALDPKLPIRPGDVAMAPALPPGAARDAFRLYASLAPGTLPSGLDAEGRLIVHALDTDQPVERDIRAAEALFAGGAHG